MTLKSSDRGAVVCLYITQSLCFAVIQNPMEKSHWIFVEGTGFMPNSRSTYSDVIVPPLYWLVSDCPRGADHFTQDPPMLPLLILANQYFFIYILASCDWTVLNCQIGAISLPR